MRRVLFCLLLAVLSLVLAACGGGGGGDGRALVKETFGNSQKIRSGRLQVALNLDPKGLPGVKGPITVRFGGPFTRPAKGAPRYAFTLSASAEGQTLSAGAVSTGRQGFVSVQRTNYVLPAAQYARLNRSYEQVTGVAQPKTNAQGDIPWLEDPKVEGDETVGGAETTHVSAAIDVRKLLDGIEERQPAQSRLSASDRQKVVDGVQDPTFDFWTGKDDKVLRRVRIAFRIAVPEDTQGRLSGLRSLDVRFDNALSDLNERQTIAPLAGAKPVAELTQQIQALVGQLGALGGGLGTGGGSPGGTAPNGGGTSGAQADRYAQCLEKAGSDITAAQKCAELLTK